ncbi:MAG: hypothetical protein AAF074_19530 [Pseudomonadota bacterium]
MIQINIGDKAGNENGVPFTPIPPANRGSFRWARRKMFDIARGNPRANSYFRSLPGGRSFTNLINDNSLWIHFDPTLPDFGATFHNNDLWVGPSAIQVGKWTILATIIHELAHINGAGGSATGLACPTLTPACHAAERAVLECGLGKRSELTTGVDDPHTPYDPGTAG